MDEDVLWFIASSAVVMTVLWLVAWHGDRRHH